MPDRGSKQAEQPVSFDGAARQTAEVRCLFVLELSIVAAGKTNCTDASVWSAN